MQENTLLLNPVSYFTAVEVNAMIRATSSPWWRAFVCVTAASGLRTQELLRLHRSDVDATRGNIRVTSEPIPCFDGLDRATLRVPTPPHREQVVPVNAHVIAALQELRADRQHDTHVFVPDWHLENLWIKIVAGERLSCNMLAPHFAEHSTAVQQMGRQRLAEQQGLPLSEVPWPLRSVHSLRNAYARKTALHESPSSLKSLLGYASVRSVMPFYHPINPTPAEMAGCRLV